MTTPEKPECDHIKAVGGEHLSTIINTHTSGPVCVLCGARFVSEDLLREAVRILRENEFHQCNCGADTEPMECLECPAQIGDPHKDGCALATLLARIDAALGKG